MFEQQTSIKQQESRALEKLLDQITNFTSVVPGPLTRVFNHHNIMLDPPEILEKIQGFLELLTQSEKNFVKDSVAVEWFIQLSLFILHLACKQKGFLRKMNYAFCKVSQFRKIKSLLNKQVKDMIVMKAFADLCFLQLYVQNKQYLQLEEEVRKLIRQYERFEDPILKIPLSQLVSIRCIVGEVMHNKVSEKCIHKTVQLRREVIGSFKEYFDRAILAFYISDTVNISMKIFQCKSINSTAKQKAEFVKKLHEEICTKDFFGESVLKNLKAKFSRIVSAEMEKISSTIYSEVIKQEEDETMKKQKQKVHYERNKSCNSLLYQTPLSTTLHKQPYRSLHRSNCDQMSVIRYLLRSKEKIEVKKPTNFSYSCLKQNTRPVQKQLNLQALQNQLHTITQSNTYVKRPLISLSSFKVRKNNSYLTRRLKRISMVLQQQNLVDSCFIAPVRFSKYLNGQVANIEILFMLQKDSGSIQLIIRQPHIYFQLCLFNLKKVPSINSALLITRYKQQLQNSMYYYEFFDGVRDEIESSDIVDMMLSQLILEYQGRLERKLLCEYMILKEYVSKYFYWKHLRKVCKLSGFSYKIIPVPEVQDFLKFSLYLQNIIKSERVVISANPLSKSKMKKSMFPILQYLSDSRQIATKMIKRAQSEYYMDVVVSNKSNIKQIQLVEGTIKVQKAQYSLKIYSFKSLNYEPSSPKAFKSETVDSREMITNLLFVGYLTKSMNLRLFAELMKIQQPEICIGKRVRKHDYRRSMIQDSTITLLDEDLKFDEKFATPKSIGEVETLLSNRTRQIPFLLGLVNIVLEQSLRQLKIFQSKLLYKTMKHYPALGYFHVAVRVEHEYTRRIITLKLYRIQQQKQHIFKIQQSFLQKMFPRLNYEEVIDSMVINNYGLHMKLLMRHHGSHIQSMKNSQNRPAVLYRRKICSKVMKRGKEYYVFTVYYNLMLSNWEIELYNQRQVLLKAGFINLFQLGLISLNSDLTNTDFTQQDWFIYLVQPHSINKQDPEEAMMWASLLDRLSFYFQENYLQISSVIIYIERRICFLNAGKRWIEVCFDQGSTLEESSFSIYGYQQGQPVIYSNINYVSAKQLYMLDYYFEEGAYRQILLKFACYIVQKIDNQQYDQPIYIFKPKQYLTHKIEVMVPVIKHQSWDLRRNIQEYAERQVALEKQQNLEEHSRGIQIKYWKLKQGRILLWMMHEDHQSTVVYSDYRMLQSIKGAELASILVNLLILC